MAAFLCVVLLADAANAQADATPEIAALEETSFQQAVAAVDPSVVRIETVGGVDLVGEVLTAAGPTTGVVVSADGFIITSRFNFISKPTSIVVTLADGTKLPAQIVGDDMSRMLTLLKVDASGLSPIQPAPVESSRIGSWALAVGRTFELEFPNLSVGIVSAVERLNGRAIQTDAKVSPLNYGGPLVDLAGRALGVLVPLSPQQKDETAGVEWYDGGIGFAVPMADIYRVLPRLQAGETLKQGLIGI
ncbi:MAG: trypsin-like peptidase domain-containing protein, partial [Planctomycetaceae bacterium]|nr:trypsin-like peptidase domain-containing protein [Planctomycetaceae bacterium]